jgi:hypothetical protein
MTPKIESGSFTTDAAISTQSGSQRQFDTFETKFFEQGDDESAGVAVAVERFDDLDELGKRKKLAPSRQFMMGVGAGSTVIAIIGCLALWRSSGKSHAVSSLAVELPAQAQTEPAPANPAAMVAPAQAEPVPANSAIAAAPAPAEPVPANPAVAAAPAQAEQALAPAPVPAVAEDHVAPSPASAAPAIAEPVPAAAEKPAAPAAKPQAAPAVAEAKPAPAAAADSSDAQARCKKAISDKRSKEILAACPDAFAAETSAADIAVALAKIEFDRGRGAQASEWGKKALAADPNAADAYVFIGGAEQSAGHRKAAKEAYKRYLQLAPGGRYAADLRSIVGSL